jgi:DNA-binding NarL/FixJ family response regulator
MPDATPGEPLTAEEGAHPSTAARSRRGAAASLRRRHGPGPIRVLLVDDDPAFAAALTLLLDLADDIEVVGRGGNGRAAIEMTAMLDPDVVVMDVNMPVVDGLEATRWISRSSNAAIILLTAETSPRTERLARSFGASAFLSKRSDPFDLIDWVRDVHVERAHAQAG